MRAVAVKGQRTGNAAPCQTCQVAESERSSSASAPGAAVRRRQRQTIGPKNLAAKRFGRWLDPPCYAAFSLLLHRFRRVSFAAAPGEHTAGIGGIINGVPAVFVLDNARTVATLILVVCERQCQPRYAAMASH